MGCDVASCDVRRCAFKSYDVTTLQTFRRYDVTKFDIPALRRYGVTSCSNVSYGIRIYDVSTI